MKADFGLWRRWRRLKEWPEFLVDVAERAIVQEEGFIDFGQAFEDGGVGGEVLAHFDEGTNDVHAHRDGAGAVEDVGGHEGAVFGEGVGQSAAATAAGF